MHWSRTKNRDKIVQKIRISKIGARNHQWNDTNPSYHSVHNWLWSNHRHEKIVCQLCGSKRFLEWALKKGETHSHSIKKYIVLCSSCHKKYDYTDEHRLNIKKALTGRKITWASKIGDANRGRVASEEAKKKMSVWHKNHPKKRNEKGQFTNG